MSARFEAFAQTSSKSILVVWVGGYSHSQTRSRFTNKCRRQDEDHVDGLIDSLDINGDKPQFPAG